jgi:hypothetical protein
MKVKTALLAPAAALLLSAAPTLASPPSTASRPSTPNSCIELNRGDWNACNVANSGAGGLHYRN